MSSPPAPRVCVVVPTYNEMENIGPLLDDFRKVRTDEMHLLFVDDSSPDGTGQVIAKYAASEPWVHLVSRDSKRGIGSAYLEGFKQGIATLKPDVLVEMDADLQHPPEMVPRLVDAVRSGADVAIASRYVKGGRSRGWGFGRRAVSRSANWLSRNMLQLAAKDCTSGFRAYRARSAQKLLAAKMPASGFEFQVASLHALRGDAKVSEVPYTFVARKAGKSKLGPLDVFRFSFYLLWTYLGD